jgi:hypothetical protein
VAVLEIGPAEFIRNGGAGALHSELGGGVVNRMTKARFTGCLAGLAVGDAVGTTVEFQPPGSFPPVTELIGGGPFGLRPGGWPDDTSMALCLAESLITCGNFDARDQDGPLCTLVL